MTKGTTMEIKTLRLFYTGEHKTMGSMWTSKWQHDKPTTNLSRFMAEGEAAGEFRSGEGDKVDVEIAMLHAGLGYCGAGEAIVGGDFNFSSSVHRQSLRLCHDTCLLLFFLSKVPFEL
jgi:alpha/beta superfamily hydrolase